MSELQFGLQLYSVRDRCQDKDDMLACLKELKAVGYNVVQLAGHSADITPEMIKAMMDESGLNAISIHGSYDRLKDDFDAYIKDLKTIGVKSIGTGMPGDLRTTPEGVMEFIKQINKIVPKLEDNGIHYGYHNHAFEFERFFPVGKNAMELMLENCIPEMKFELDLFWVQRGGANPIDMLRKFDGRMFTTHIKDMNGSKDSVATIAAVGKGNLNFAQILPVAGECGSQYVFIEQDNAPASGNSVEEVAFSLNTLKGMGFKF